MSHAFLSDLHKIIVASALLIALILVMNNLDKFK